MQAANANTARAVIVKNGMVLLMERWRKDAAGRDMHYFSVPGGTVEKNETPEVAVVRELFEEMNMVIRPQQSLGTTPHGKGKHTFFVCQYLSGQPHLNPNSQEAAKTTQQFIPCWITKEQFNRITLHPDYEPMRQAIAALL